MGVAKWIVVGALTCVGMACGGSDDGGGSSGGAGGASTGGASTGGASTGGASGSTGGSGADTGGAGGDQTGGAGGWVSQCPYAAANFACDAACDNLQAIAAKCKDDPSIPTDIRAILEAVAAGTGNACKIKCAADSPTYGTQWSCFQAVPVAADCTAIAGCTLSNCPGNY